MQLFIYNLHNGVNISEINNKKAQARRLRYWTNEQADILPIIHFINYITGKHIRKWE